MKSIKEWCTTDLISIEWIDQQALEQLEMFKTPDTVYMSLDIYAELYKQLVVKTRHKYSALVDTSLMIQSVATSAGILTVKQVSNLTNFCHIGTESTFERLEWIKVDQEFEDIILSSGIKT